VGQLWGSVLRPEMLTMSKQDTQAPNYPLGGRLLTATGADAEYLRWLGFLLGHASSPDVFAQELRKALLLDDAHLAESEEQFHFAFY
jgi:hypothetical protein